MGRRSFGRQYRKVAIESAVVHRKRELLDTCIRPVEALVMLIATDVYKRLQHMRRSLIIIILATTLATTTGSTFLHRCRR
jgi:hypothetical protein